MLDRRHFVVAVILGLMICGCGGSRAVKVAGKVTYQGKPVPGVTVRFVPEEGLASSGKTNADGQFTLHYERDKEGALIGKYSVAIVYSPASRDEQLGLKPSKLSPELLAVIEKYGDAESSDLHYEISRSGQFIDIELH